MLLNAEVYDTLREAGASEEKARAAAMSVTEMHGVEPIIGHLDKLNGRLDRIESQFTGRLDRMEALLDRMESRVAKLERDVAILSWAVSANFILTVAVFVKLFVG